MSSDITPNSSNSLNANSSKNINEINNITQSQQKRGRGRPRKNQIFNQIDKHKNDTNKNQQTVKKIIKQISDKNITDDIVLHLQITQKKINNIKHININNKENTENTENTENIENTENTENTENIENIENELSAENEEKTKNVQIAHNLENKINPHNESKKQNIFTINDNDSFGSDNSSNDSKNELKQLVKEHEKTIKQLEKQISEYKQGINKSDSIDNTNNETRTISKMNLELINIMNGKSIIVEKTNIVCWWCTYNFDTMPCFIPENINDNKYYVFGCFCSFNCASAYNINMIDYNVWYRNTLLKKLYNTMFENTDDVIIAPPRETFEKFGGILTYNEYRKNCKKCNNTATRFIMPPMISIIPMIEQIGKNSNNKNNKLSDINKNNYILKRSKPLPNYKHSLLDTMKLKKGKT